MRTPARAGLLVVIAATTVALGGCRDGAAAAPGPAPTAGAALAGVDSSLDAIERQLDRDSSG